MTRPLRPSRDVLVAAPGLLEDGVPRLEARSSRRRHRAAPGTDSSAQSAPGPQASACTSPSVERARSTSVAGPSGVRMPRQTRPRRRSRNVGSPPPWRCWCEGADRPGTASRVATPAPVHRPRLDPTARRRHWNTFYLSRHDAADRRRRNRVRTLTLDRPEALNAFNEALYDALADALLDAADDPTVAVVLLTGNGRGFCAGTDLLEMHRIATDPTFERGKHGFLGLRRRARRVPEAAGLSPSTASGWASARTILGFADLAFMSSDRPAQVPVHLPRASRPRRRRRTSCRCWSAARTPRGCCSPRSGSPPHEALEMGLVWRVCEPDDLLRRGAPARRGPGRQADLVPGRGEAHHDRAAAGRASPPPASARTPPSPS